MHYFNFYRINLVLCLFIWHLLALSAQTKNEGHLQKDIVYGHADGIDLLLDLIQPVDREGPYPVILFFHGGGWQAGDKSHGHHWMRLFAEAGYVGVSVRYRFAPAFKWPSQVEDAKAAVRFLRQQADTFHIDPDRIGVMGESAGGYLALMLGLTGPQDSLEGSGGSPDYSSRVEAVVSYFSSTDFTLPKVKLTPEAEAEVQQYYGKTLPEVLADFIGTREPEVTWLARMSPVNYVDANDPPVQIFQGDADPFVSVEQASALDRALKKAKVPHQLVIVKGAGHGWRGPLKEDTTSQMMGFFERYLKERK